LTFSVVDPRTCLQCENANRGFFNDNTATLSGDDDRCNGSGNITLRYQELFPTVFRRRNQANPGTTGTVPPFPYESQDTLGLVFQTETGYYKNAAAPPVFGNSRWPETASMGSSTPRIAGQQDGTLGLASHGTRLIARFTNVQNGVQIWVNNTANVNNQQLSAVTGQAVLVTTDPNGAGPFSATPAGTTVNGGMTQVSVVGGTGQAVWEIVNADTTAIERINFGVVIAYLANTTNNLPSLGTSSANGNLAPLSTVSTASTSAPIPRFVDTATNRTMLTINSCRTNILFPFVSNQAGFDTGLAIANTSKDPFGTALQTGACTVNFYGYVGTSKVCLSFPSPSITGGEHFVWSLANGGAVTATAGFQGYVIAQCAFQYGHGYAFISDLGAQRLAQGYVALILDEGIASRTGSQSETLGH
jgi:hypothetical protein